MASTVIDNATMPEIRDATALVFERDFYHIIEDESYREDSFLLRADAYTMRGEFGQPEKLLRMTGGSYQALLDRVRVSLIKSSDTRP